MSLLLSRTALHTTVPLGTFEFRLKDLIADCFHYNDGKDICVWYLGTRILTLKCGAWGLALHCTKMNLENNIQRNRMHTWIFDWIRVCRVWVVGSGSILSRQSAYKWALPMPPKLVKGGKMSIQFHFKVSFMRLKYYRQLNFPLTLSSPICHMWKTYNQPIQYAEGFQFPNCKYSIHKQQPRMITRN